MSTRHVLRRLAGRIKPAVTVPSTTWRNGTIAAVTAGAAADGNAAVTVTVGSDTIPAPYLASYTPTVGHMVRVEFTGGSPLIHGHIIGLPDF